MFGLIGSFTAISGKRDELINILLANAASLPGCINYLVSKDPENIDTIWITEVWDCKQSHQDSLQLNNVKEAIAKAIPLIASFGMRQELNVVGGFGL